MACFCAVTTAVRSFCGKLMTTCMQEWRPCAALRAGIGSTRWRQVLPHVHVPPAAALHRRACREPFCSGRMRRFRVVYRLVGSVYLVLVAHAGACLAALLRALQGCVRVLLAAARGVEVTPDKIAERYPEVHTSPLLALVLLCGSAASAAALPRQLLLCGWSTSERRHARRRCIWRWRGCWAAAQAARRRRLRRPMSSWPRWHLTAPRPRWGPQKNSKNPGKKAQAQGHGANACMRAASWVARQHLQPSAGEARHAVLCQLRRQA